MATSKIANGARGEIVLDLGGERYVLRPEFGIVAKIENALGTSLFKLAMKAELFDFKAEELVRTLRAVLAAHGHELEEETLAKAMAEDGVAAVLVPITLFLRGYVWGGRPEKKAGTAAAKTTAKSRKNGKSQATSSASA